MRGGIDFFRSRFKYDPINGVLYNRNTNAPAYLDLTTGTPRVRAWGMGGITAKNLAWALAHGEIPGVREIRLLDGNPLNLKLANLHKTPAGYHWCATCQKDLPTEEFYVKQQRKRYGKDSYCKACTKQRRKETHKPGSHRPYALRKYGLTEEGYKELLAKQNFTCAICQKPETGKSLAVDHCHSTGKVRGLLCSMCNTALGLFGDSIEYLDKATTYLKNAQPQKTKG